jgi:hypothetical protein
MAPKEPQDKDEIGRVGQAGLVLVSDRTLSWDWESFTPPFERTIEKIKLGLKGRDSRVVLLDGKRSEAPHPPFPLWKPRAYLRGFLFWTDRHHEIAWRPAVACPADGR